MPGPTLSRVAPFNIDAADCVAGRATVHGREVDVLEICTADQRVLALLEHDPKAVDLDAIAGIVGRCCPSLTPDEIGRLRPRQLGMLIGVAQSGVREVEQQVPNAEGPTTEQTISSPPA